MTFSPGSYYEPGLKLLAPRPPERGHVEPLSSRFVAGPGRKGVPFCRPPFVPVGQPGQKGLTDRD